MTPGYAASSGSAACNIETELAGEDLGTRLLTDSVTEEFSMHVKAAVVLIVGALNVLLCYSAIPDDRIKVLPGWNGSLPSAQYSGYIKLDPSNGRRMHYW